MEKRKYSQMVPETSKNPIMKNFLRKNIGTLFSSEIHNMSGSNNTSLLFSLGNYNKTFKRFRCLFGLNRNNFQPSV